MREITGKGQGEFEMECIEVTAKTVDDAITEGLIKLGTTSDKVETEIIEKGSVGFLGIGSKPAVIKIWKKFSIEEFVRGFLDDVFRAMGLEVEIIVKKSEDEKNIDVELKGEEMGVLIGKRGQTLDSLQYLTNLAVGKQVNEFVKVKIDTENYRKRRRETLESLARNIAYKVKRTKRPVSLEPMNPFERRVIHSTLQGDKYVNTHSEGEEPYRYGVVTMKKNIYTRFSKYFPKSYLLFLGTLFHSNGQELIVNANFSVLLFSLQKLSGRRESCRKIRLRQLQQP